MAYSVRTADLARLESILPQIWQRNLPIESDPAERFEWSHERNPAGPCATFLLECTDGDTPEVVGSTTIFPRHFVVFGQTVAAGVLGDVAVDRAHRTLFPALSLQRAARDFSRANLAVLYALPNNQARPLYQRLRFAQLGEMVRYARPLLVEENVPTKLPLRWMLRPLAGLADRALERWGDVRRRLTPTDWKFRWLDEPDSRFDELWQRACRGVTVIGRRDADFLRWRFCHKPDEAFLFGTLECGDRLEAYAVVQFEDHVALLRDLFASDDTQLDRFLRMLMPALRQRGARTVTFRFLGSPWLVDLLSRHGFRAREGGWTVIVEPGDNLPVARDVLLNPNNWYLTDCDEDT